MLQRDNAKELKKRLLMVGKWPVFLYTKWTCHFNSVLVVFGRNLLFGVSETRNGSGSRDVPQNSEKWCIRQTNKSETLLITECKPAMELKSHKNWQPLNLFDCVIRAGKYIWIRQILNAVHVFDSHVCHI
jgi:hypothetical protein